MCARLVLVAITAAVTALTSGTVIAADSTERTTMPDFCSRRDVNCVIPDGGPRVVPPTGAVPQQPVATTQTNSATAGVTQRGAVAGTTTITTDSSGVKTVFTPDSGGPITAAGAPSGSTTPSTGTTGGTTTSTTGAAAGLTTGAGTSTGGTGTATSAGGGFGRR